MERLTQKLENGNISFRGRLPNYNYFNDMIGMECYNDYCNALYRLAQYEDMEESGQLIVLPCKVGDKVYINTPSGATLCEIVDSITKPEFRTRTLSGLRGLDFSFNEYGKTVFLSRKELEKALDAKNNSGAAHEEV